MSTSSDQGLRIEHPQTKRIFEFETPQKLLEWVDQLRSQWRWLGHTPIRSPWSELENDLNSIQQAAREWGRYSSSGRPREFEINRIRAAIQNIHRKGNPFWDNEHNQTFLKKVREEQGDAAAAGAFAALSEAELNFENPVNKSFFDGLLRGFLFQNEIDWTASVHRKTLEDLEAKYKKHLKDQEVRLEKLELENTRLNDAHNKTLNNKAALLDELNSTKASLLDGLHQAKTTALDDLHASKDKVFADLAVKHEANFKTIEDTFHNKLALQKPIDYWRTKKDDHIKLAKRFAWVSGAFLLFAGIGLGFLVSWCFGSLGTGENPKHWQVGVTIIAAFFVIWVVRLLIRMFLSNQHLAADAAERVTMVQTYLSLSLEGQGITATDRSVILQQLFRSASDGLVKDDGAPPSWLELLTRQK